MNPFIPSLATIPDGFILINLGCSNHNYLGITKKITANIIKKKKKFRK